MQVIGICRFSYPALGGFKIEHASTKDRFAFLYHPTRMSERFRFFETICLPRLKSQTDPDFISLIVIADSLPEPHKRRLTRLLETVPQAVLVSRTRRATSVGVADGSEPVPRRQTAMFAIST